MKSAIKYFTVDEKVMHNKRHNKVESKNQPTPDCDQPSRIVSVNLDFQYSRS